jgi:N-methylhydantoinase A
MRAMKSLAELLGVKRVLFPPHAGALSALGMAAASDVVEHAVSVHLPAQAFAARAPEIAAPLAARVAEQLPGAAVRYVAECRYARQGYELDVPCGEGAWENVARDFHQVHERAFGHREAQGEILVVALRAVGTVAGGARKVRWPRRSTMGSSARLRIRLEQGDVDAVGADWEGLHDGKVLAGPAVIEGLSATALIPPGWVGRVNRIGAIIVEPGDARTD